LGFPPGAVSIRPDDLQVDEDGDETDADQAEDYEY
jgi:hypothetical protein